VKVDYGGSANNVGYAGDYNTPLLGRADLSFESPAGYSISVTGLQKRHNLVRAGIPADGRRNRSQPERS
jgi:hypothetical protein